MRKLSILLLASALLPVTTTIRPSFADDWHGHGYGDHWDHGFHGFNYDHWRGGQWFNGFHEGRNGWWWIVDGLWYFYPAPVYPYPDPYTPPTVVVQAAPAVAGAPPAYYYCANPAGYYPAVPECAAGWQKIVSASVPVAPPPMAAPSLPPAVPAPPAMGPAPSPQDIDMQQLNVFAARLQSIDPADSHARAKLKDLAKQVEAFRQSLYKRNYNAMEVLKDAEDLKTRIATERSWLVKHPGSLPPASPSAVVTPPLAAPPVAPGTTVTFPPQQ